MEAMAMMAVISIVSSLVNMWSSSSQQQKEFNQQNALLQQQQDFQREREDILFNRQRAGQTYDDLRDLGVNPSMAVAALLGGNLESASSANSPSAPPVNSAINALQNTIGQGGQNLYDIYLKHLQGENIKANTNKTEVEAGLLPRDYELRKMSTLKQLDVWDASVKKMASEVGYNEQMTKLVEQQNLYYGRLSEAQINSYIEQTNLNIQKAKESQAKIEQMEHENANIDADTALKKAETGNVIQDTSLKVVQTDLEFQRSERERIAKEFETENSAPLTADAKAVVRKLAREGKYDEIQQFYDVIFRSALNQELGTAYGTPQHYELKTPFTKHSGYRFDMMSNPNAPVWNYNPYKGASASW